MGIVVAQSQDVAALARLSAQAAGTAASAMASAAVSRLPGLTASAGASQSASAHVVGAVSLAGVLQTAGSQQAHGLASLGAIGSVIVVQATNVNTARIVASLPRLLGKGATTALGAASVTARLALAAKSNETASQAVRAKAALQRLWTAFTLAAQATGAVRATLGPLAAKGTVQPPPSGYTPDGNYYVALQARPFYATLAARSFYVLSNPNMTPTFDILDPRETLVLTFDASADLEDGETLTAINEVTAVLQFGAAGSELPTLEGEVVNQQPLSLTVNGKPVTVAAGCGVQVIASGGVSGCRYLITATCATSNPDKVLALKGVLPVSAN